MFGQAAEMDAIMEIADAHNINVIEDAAQAIGADYNGKQIGSIAIGCFSLRFWRFLVKNKDENRQFYLSATMQPHHLKSN